MSSPKLCHPAHYLAPTLPPPISPSPPFPPPPPKSEKGSSPLPQTPKTTPPPRPRRASNRSSSISSVLTSPPYHSGGINSAIPHAVSGAKFSIRLSQGSKLPQPVTPRYTVFSAKTPPRCTSTNFQSPAWKQYPWSINVA